MYILMLSFAVESFQCPSDGYFSDPCDCSKFYQCWQGIAYQKSCQSGLLWNQERQYCDWDYNVECSVTAKSPATTTTKPTTSTASTSTTTNAPATSTSNTGRPCSGELLSFPYKFILMPGAYR